MSIFHSKPPTPPTDWFSILRAHHLATAGPVTLHALLDSTTRDIYAETVAATGITPSSSR